MSSRLAVRPQTDGVASSRRPRHSRRILLVVGTAALVIGVALALGVMLQNRLIYYPTQQVPAVGDVLAGGEAVRFRTDDGLAINAWFLTAAAEPAAATIIVFNGNAGNRSDRAPLARGLAASGFSVLLVDYRGYGGNPGTPSERGLNADAAAALTYAKSRADVDPSRIAYFGESLGSAVAVTLALAEPPVALVLRSPFTSLVDVGRAAFPFVPVGLILRDHYASIDRIRDADAAVLVIAGSADGIVPAELSRRLYDAAREPKAWALIEGADHNDFELASGPQVVDATAAFVREHLPET